MSQGSTLQIDETTVRAGGPDVIGGLPLRFWVSGAALAVEIFAVGMLGHPWFQAHGTKAAPMVFFAGLLLFGRRGIREARLGEAPVGWGYARLHAAAATAFLVMDVALLRWGVSGSGWTHMGVGAWFVLLVLAGMSLVAANVAPRSIAGVVSRLRWPMLFAALCGAGAAGAGWLMQRVWGLPDSWLGRRMVAGAFAGVRAVLGVFYPQVVVDVPTAVIGTQRFQVQVAGGCSGIEGMGMILLLTLGWLIFARRELRMRRAVWLVPAALVVMWCLNIVRIALLIAIGDAGHADIASRGFHSEAGWIAFTAVSLVFLTLAQKVRWLRQDSGEAVHVHGETNVAAVYLLPFLAITGMSMLTRAASSGFEGLYWLRLAGAVAVLVLFRRAYRQIDWRCGWVGIAGGAAVGVMWVALEHGGDGRVIAAGLASMAGWQRSAWLAARVVAAAVTVPIAEELAFRGFLARRVMSDDVEHVDYSNLGWVAIAVSSLLFGAMHGRMWIAGTLAGVVFALAAKMRGRLGEAVGAHAVANLVLAVWVLWRGDYSLW